MEKTIEKFTKIVSYVLLICGMIFIAFQTVELIWEIARGFYNRFQEPSLDYIPEYFKPVAVLFFNILLFLEILETVRVFDKAHEIKIRIIITVCLIAVSRKVLVMDTHKSDPFSDLAIAALILAFAISYFLVRKNEKLTENK